MEAAETDPLLGTTLAGRFEVLRLLGRGGMGAVYQARQVGMDRLVALKLIAMEGGVVPEAALDRFQQEMRATARVEHPNTIRLYDYGRAGERLYLAMEFLPGRSLRDVVNSEAPLAPARAVRIGLQVARALGAAHEQGIVHRDLKPENVMLLDVYGERDFVKVLDFGIARFLDGGEGQRLTATGAIIGTPAYMSPEQAHGREVDARTDLYALGVMLYELVSGRPPFVRPSAVSLLVAHTSEAPPPIEQQAPTLPPALAKLIMQLLTKDPGKRPASAAEVIERLTAMSTTTGDAPRVSATAVANTAPLPAVTAPTVAARKRRAPLWFLALGLCALAGAAWWRLRGPDNAALRARIEAARRDPAPPAACLATDAETLAALAPAAEALARPQGAKMAREALSKASDQSAERWVLHAQLELAAGAHAEAVKSAAAAVALCPSWATAQNTLGRAAVKAGEPARAKAAFRAASAADARYLAPRFNLALVTLEENDPKTAIAALDEIIAQDPRHPNAHLLRGQARLLAGDTAAAEADLLEATRQAPTAPEGHFLLGSARAKLGKPEAAASLCEAKRLGHASAPCPK